MQRRSRVLLVFAVGFLSASGETFADADGVKYRIDLTVSVDPTSPLTLNSSGKALMGWISVSIRLSANFRETRFFGVLNPTFSVVSMNDDFVLVPQTKIWEEEVCHQRRGLPKMTVTGVNGVFGSGEKRFQIGSVSRRTGVRVPGDELVPGQKLSTNVDRIGQYYAFRSQTQRSRLKVDLKLYASQCTL